MKSSRLRGDSYSQNSRNDFIYTEICQQIITKFSKY
nr:MAG TPA: hypothetical protein [Caudoviricetes sp.]